MRHRPGRAVLGAAIVVVLLGGGCTGAASSSPTPITARSGSAPVVTPSPAATIPQPPETKLNERTRRRLAPESARIDLQVPSFSHPAEITNPLFPISDLTSAVLVGQLGGAPWRAETTLLPETQVVSWNGQQVETRLSQFIAFLDGRIFEVAVDRYAQADDGSVWYLGEDAYSYEHGRVSDTEGTWLAGQDGPPAMIMPGHPQVGDVYRTENIPPVVFEQVTVQRVGVSVRGPTGPVHGAMIGQELHLDERRLEEKTFAPGYGEFFSGSGHTYEATALAIPVNAVSEPTPEGLEAVLGGALGVLRAAGRQDWTGAATALHRMTTSWDALRTTQEPRRLSAEMDGALRRLGRAIDSRSPVDVRDRAIDVARAALDLELQYRSPGAIDAARFGLWTRQLEADAAAHDRAGVVGDASTLRWIWDRLDLPGAQGRRVTRQLRSLKALSRAGDLEASARVAKRLRTTVLGIGPPA